MTAIADLNLEPDQAALWFLGQAGYLIRSAGVTVVMDPYLTDSAAASAPEFTRLFPPPLAPEDLHADLYLVTHDHLDHLDPETIRRYRHRGTTQFVAPRLAARKLRELGVPAENIQRLDAGEDWTSRGLAVSGIFALPTGRCGRMFAIADREVGKAGLGAGCVRLLRFVNVDVTARGTEHLPAQDPLLAVANHPGACDSLAIASCIPRRDLKIVVREIPFFHALPNTSPCFPRSRARCSGRSQRPTSRWRCLRASGRGP